MRVTSLAHRLLLFVLASMLAVLWVQWPVAGRAHPTATSPQEAGDLPTQSARAAVARSFAQRTVPAAVPEDASQSSSVVLAEGRVVDANDQPVLGALVAVADATLASEFASLDQLAEQRHMLTLVQQGKKTIGPSQITGASGEFRIRGEVGLRSILAWKEEVGAVVLTFPEGFPAELKLVLTKSSR